MHRSSVSAPDLHDAPVQALGGQPRLIARLALIGSLYLAQAIPMGFVFGAMPVVLRQQGASLRQIGLLFLLHLPWVLKLFYAARLESLRPGPLGRRKSWIAPMQWLAALALACAARLDPVAGFAGIFLLLLAYNLAMATGDIAVDGYATDILKPEELRWGAALQASGRFVGMMLGGGLLLTLYVRLGWGPVCALLAVVTLALSLPVLLTPEIPPVCAAQERPQGEDVCGLADVLRLPKVRWAMPVLILPTAFLFSGFQMRLPLMSDLGLGSAVMGGVLMQWAYPAGLCCTFAAGWFLRRCGSLVLMRVLCAVGLVLTAASAWLALGGRASPVQAAWLLACDNALLGAANVWGYTLIMRLCQGGRSGTGVAILGSLFILPPIVLGPFVGGLGDRVGFAALYGVLGLFMVVGWRLAEALHAAARRKGLALLSGPGPAQERAGHS
ncbi:Major Facilitator Superfamily protein [Humidesulfovibrio mexicanus]|uniref:Major Facilitator Superfamily protein n=1 Tax=Humidesulfovibrio mexicanus TaxID=147047 RepID=A0A238Y888_9BACT|nr:MFS transporter [Humidesulfovibrio mexicanus]SNR67048.1 Major Facilitator Superfamily protein [Humidesulfovibrio mexicanus]